MRSATDVRRRRTEPAAVEGDDRRLLSQVRTNVVGLAGLEPAASSLSGIEGSALCGSAFSQVAGERQGRRDAFLATSFQGVQAGQAGLRALARDFSGSLGRRCI